MYGRKSIHYLHCCHLLPRCRRVLRELLSLDNGPHHRPSWHLSPFAVLLGTENNCLKPGTRDPEKSPVA